MTQITLYSSGDRYRVEAEGHATGSEKVCAAVSMLLYTVAGYLMNYGEDLDPVTDLDSGHAVLEWTGDGHIFDLTELGFLQLANSEPQYCSVSYAPRRGAQ